MRPEEVSNFINTSKWEHSIYRFKSAMAIREKPRFRSNTSSAALSSYISFDQQMMPTTAKFMGICVTPSPKKSSAATMQLFLPMVREKVAK